MKKYLKDLEAELRKLKLSDKEIKEILEDHIEMITEAQEEGVTDEELVSKFGNPDKVAVELSKTVTSQSTEPVLGEGSLEGYELVESFTVLEDLKKVSVQLVSEDLLYFPYEGEILQVFAKGNYDPEDYTIEYDSGSFKLKKEGKKKIFFSSKNTPDFGVKVPVSSLDKFSLSLVSGDAEVEGVTAKEVAIKTTSGDIKLNNLNTTSDLAVSVVSGDCVLSGVNALGMAVSLVSGDLEMSKVRLEEGLNVNNVSGDVVVRNLETPEITFKTVSGDFEGFEVYCEGVSFSSVSGDFRINNSDKEHKIELKSKKTLSGDVTIN